MGLECCCGYEYEYGKDCPWCSATKTDKCLFFNYETGLPKYPKPWTDEYVKLRAALAEASK